MYSQILYFIVALMLITVQQQGPSPFLPFAETGLLAAAVLGLFVLTCRLASRRLTVAATRFSPSNLAIRYHRLQLRLQILALTGLAFDVLVLNVQYYFNRIPLVEHSLTLSGLIGLALYLAHVTAIWVFSHPAYQAVFQSTIRRRTFIKTHLSFCLVILFSWLTIAIASDLLDAFSPFAFLRTSIGEYAYLGVVMLLFMLFAPGPVVHLWGCQPLPEQPLRTELADFCREHRFRVGNLMLWPLFGGEMLTAAIVGILPRLRYILITRSLLSILTPDELKAVVAHEMGHVRRLHLPMFLLFFLFFMPVAGALTHLLSLSLLKQDFVLRWLLAADSSGPGRGTILSGFLMVLLMVVFFRFIFGFFLRNCERQADLYAMKLVGSPNPLITSLQKIAVHSGQIEDLPSWHHFSIRQRINCLVDASRDASFVRRHNRKLYASAAAFVVAVVMVLTASGSLLSSSVFKKWFFDLDPASVQRALQEEPGNAGILSLYGQILLEAGRLDEAEPALRKALRLSPDDPGLLNALAWLYATSKPPHFNPEAALKLATRAVELNPDPAILDTLAEAYYVNGRYREALDTIEKALGKASDDKSELLTHKEKYRKALEGSGRS